MILTFRRIDPIPKNIGFMLSITFWIFDWAFKVWQEQPWGKEYFI